MLHWLASNLGEHFTTSEKSTCANQIYPHQSTDTRGKDR